MRLFQWIMRLPLPSFTSLSNYFAMCLNSRSSYRHRLQSNEGQIAMSRNLQASTHSDVVERALPFEAVHAVRLVSLSLGEEALYSTPQSVAQGVADYVVLPSRSEGASGAPRIGSQPRRRSP